MGGKRYKLRGLGKNIGATAVAHGECNGSGMAACGCVELDAGELALVGGTSGTLGISVASDGRNVWSGATTAGYDS